MHAIHAIHTSIRHQRLRETCSARPVHEQHRRQNSTKSLPSGAIAAARALVGTTTSKVSSPISLRSAFLAPAAPSLSATWRVGCADAGCSSMLHCNTTCPYHLPHCPSPSYLIRCSVFLSPYLSQLPSWCALFSLSRCIDELQSHFSYKDRRRHSACPSCGSGAGQPRFS